ncbi:hypothetical protein OsJ_23465 [Oryza sativa Japonica Group]|uniref:Uncharacterized protein n=1 Tax=Oryza sativa subsp. japonica TaxID=39947 RepID=B9FW19_ORYSJ|nr:hypothetical protein OsJ_23465 [Oryza sativa Japonica Group]
MEFGGEGDPVPGHDDQVEADGWIDYDGAARDFCCTDEDQGGDGGRAADVGDVQDDAGAAPAYLGLGVPDGIQGDPSHIHPAAVDPVLVPAGVQAAAAPSNAQQAAYPGLLPGLGSGGTQVVVGAFLGADNAFSSDVIDNMVEGGMWFELDGYLQRFTPRSFSSNDPAILHKILYLICRKGCLKMLLDAKLFEQADSFFASSILPLAAAPASPYARDDDVQARIHVLQQAVELRDGRLLELPADETAVPKLQQKINDYLRFYLPREIGYTPEPGLRSTMWEFAIKCDNRPYKRGNKPDIRCLLCQKLFLHADITQCMKGHLSKHCPMSTQSSLERFHIALKKEGKKKKPVTDEFEKNKRIKIGGTMPNQQGQLSLINHIDSSDIDKQIDAGRKVLDKFRSCENEMCKSALEEMEQVLNNISRSARQQTHENRQVAIGMPPLAPVLPSDAAAGHPQLPAAAAAGPQDLPEAGDVLPQPHQPEPHHLQDAPDLPAAGNPLQPEPHLLQVQAPLENPPFAGPPHQPEA